MWLEFDHERTLHWYKKPFKYYLELKESPRCKRVLASLAVSRIKLKGTGSCNGKNVELGFVKDEELSNVVSIKVEGHDGEWGNFRGRASLMTEPGVLKVHDGREYLLKQVEWNEFRLYTRDERTVMRTFIDRIDYKMGLSTGIDLKLVDVKDEEEDYMILAIASLWEALFFNHQSS